MFEKSDVEAAALLSLAPFGRETWTLVDALNDAGRGKYWDDVTPDWIRESASETLEAVERLLKAKRPRAAFACIRLQPSKFDAKILARLLNEMAQGGQDKPGQYMLEHYNVAEAFKHLDASPLLTLDEKASLELTYLGVLSRPWDKNSSSGIPNLERYIEKHPELFIQAITWTYKRDDGATDPEEMRIPPDRVQNMAERGYKLLEAIERIPGHDDLDELTADRLAKWVAAVRQAAQGLARGKIADVCIGQLLSGAPKGADGVWPCEAVRDVMEEIQSDDMMRGAHTGVYNSRGVVWRGEGGAQERALSEKYRDWGRALEASHPFVASRLLMELAKTYDHQASNEDTEAAIRRRLR